jgi:phosphoribosylcarboxyaminoimidazole (NCAIR) mutase
MRRREFIALAGAAAALPFVASAQPKSIPRLGVLLYSNPQSDPQMTAVLHGLNDLGYVEGRNILIETPQA